MIGIEATLAASAGLVGPPTGVTAPIPAWVNGTLTAGSTTLLAITRGLNNMAAGLCAQGLQGAISSGRGEISHAGLWANTLLHHPDWGETAGGLPVRRLKEEFGITGLHPAPRPGGIRGRPWAAG